ncbi:MAG: hypothetical protein JSS44_09405 [Proteobacteria bacterium]|nr:hypothetical protein [Pseudomonadota bacterium]
MDATVAQPEQNLVQAVAIVAVAEEINVACTAHDVMGSQSQPTDQRNGDAALRESENRLPELFCQSHGQPLSMPCLRAS